LINSNKTLLIIFYINWIVNTKGLIFCIIVNCCVKINNVLFVNNHRYLQGHLQIFNIPGVYQLIYYLPTYSVVQYTKYASKLCLQWVKRSGQILKSLIPCISIYLRTQYCSTRSNSEKTCRRLSFVTYITAGTISRPP